MTDENSESDEQTLSRDEYEMLTRLDERTERMDTKVDDVVESTDENAKKISANSHRIKRNTTVLGGYSAGVLAIIMWGADKVTRLV